MKKITLRSILFSLYTLVLAVLVTAYMGDKLYLLNFFILPILVGAYYFDIFGGIGFALVSVFLAMVFTQKLGYAYIDIPVLTQQFIYGIIFAVIGIIAGIFQRENNRLNRCLLLESLTDPLTRLYNYGYFTKRIDEEISRAERYKRYVGLIMIDIDHFKKYNDTYGHQSGNHVLVRIAELLQKSIRQSDVVFRYGGEEFAVILPETGPKAKDIAERLRQIIEKETWGGEGDEKCHIRISAGVSHHPLPKTSTYGLLERSDKALYKAKETGRNRVCVFEE